MTRTVFLFQDRGHGMTTERRAMTFFCAQMPKKADTLIFLEDPLRQSMGVRDFILGGSG